MVAEARTMRPSLEMQEDNTGKYLSLIVAGPYQIGWLLKVLVIADSHSLRFGIFTHPAGGEGSSLCRPGKKDNRWQVRARMQVAALDCVKDPFHEIPFVIAVERRVHSSRMVRGSVWIALLGCRRMK